VGGSRKISTPQLPELLQQAFKILQGSMPGARIDAIVDNWVYVWLPEIHFDGSKYPEPLKRGLWVRLPIQFPNVNPHGIVTQTPIAPVDGHPVKGHNPGHETCKPVMGLGGQNYYSWTWTGELGQGPQLSSSQDILAVVAWIERRIRNA